jgi:hypothetical protein
MFEVTAICVIGWFVCFIAALIVNISERPASLRADVIRAASIDATILFGLCVTITGLVTTI